MSEIERLRVKAWKKTGRSLRWNLLREVLAVISLRWLTLSQVQDIMVGLQGLTHGKTLTLLSELERAGYAQQARDDEDKIWKYASTPRGAKWWLPKGDPGAIPAEIVEAVMTTDSA